MGYKSGKTRLWKELTELHYPNDPDAALLIPFEPGYETWELSNIVPVLEKGSGEDEWKVWDYFKKEVVTGLVQEAKDGKRVTKLIGIDTADRCIDAATAWILNNRSQKYAQKFSSLQEIGDKTSENGWTLLYEEIKKQIDALRNSGYGIMALAWTKEKETTLFDGKKYNSVELMMHNTGKKIFESQSHLICCLFNEVRLLDKEGEELEENLTNKKGKEIGTKFHETEVYMYFRPTQYIAIAGGRYTNLPEKVPYSAENYMKVFEEAVLGQLKDTTKTIKQLKKEEKKDKEDKIKNIVEKEIKAEQEKSEEDKIKDVVNKIMKLVKEKIIPTAKINEIVGKSLKYDTVKQAQDILDKLEEAKEAERVS